MGIIHNGLRHVSPTGGLTMVMADGDAVHLNRDELVRVLDEIATRTPELLHAALEHRMVALIKSAHCASCEGHACEP